MLSLGIAIALNTTMYGVLDALLFPKTSIADPGRLHVLRFAGDPGNRVSMEERRRTARELPFVEGATGHLIHWDSGFVSVAQRGERARAVNVTDVEPNYFEVLGAPPRLGRLLTPNDVAAGTSPVVVSQRFWNEFFPDLSSPDTAVLLINGSPHPVVGVVAERGVTLGDRTDVWMLPGSEWAKYIPLSLLRLKEGASAEASGAILRGVTARWARELGLSVTDVQLTLRPLLGGSRRLRDLHFAFIAAVVAVLVIASLNISNLQLARGLHRSRELATRAALGASRKQIMQQLMAEGALLCLGGLLLGTLLSLWGIRLVTSFMPPSLGENMVAPQLSWRVLAVGAILTGLASILIGLLPAIRLSDLRLTDALKSGEGTGISRNVSRWHRALIAAEVAVSLAVLTGAALIVRAARRVYDVDVGYDTRPLFHAKARLTRSQAKEPSLQSRIADIRVHIEQTQGVASSTFYYERAPEHRQLTIQDGSRDGRMLPVGNFVYRVVAPTYLQTIGVPVVRGDDFSAFAGMPTAIVDQTMAAACWGTQNPVGQHVKLGAWRTRAPWARIVGVSRSFVQEPITMDMLERQSSCPSGNLLVLADDRDTAHVSRFGTELQLLIRGSGSVSSLPTTVLRTLQQSGPNTQPIHVTSLSNQLGLDGLRSRYSFLAGLFATFAAVAVALASLGVFAVSFYLVAQRNREFGVRIALGAQSRDIMSLLIAEARLTALIGVALGLILSVWSSTFVQSSLISRIERFDTAAFAIAALVLLATQLLSTYIPARWAASVDAVKVLRSE